jgi:3-methyladenine DNA glycosylase AlkD
MASDKELIDRIYFELSQHKNPDRAAAQQAYMKSAVPYLGLSMSALRTIVRQQTRTWQVDQSTWQDTFLDLWDTATHREHRYAANTIARARFAQKWQSPHLLPTYEHLIVTGAWWDYVDEIAAHLVGEVLRQHHREASEVVRDWASADDLWLRRTAILCQLRHRTETDQQLLAEVIELNAADPSFWIRKAIGWALREYARSNRDWVLQKVIALSAKLSPLSKREAMKHYSADEQALIGE